MSSQSHFISNQARETTYLIEIKGNESRFVIITGDVIFITVMGEAMLFETSIQN